jgi:hypothetical protein
MIPLLLCLGAFIGVLFFAQMGMSAGAYPALCGMLGTVFGALAGLRYWFLLSRVAGRHEAAPVPFHFVIIFWVLFAAAFYLASKFRHEYTEDFENSSPSPVERILGGAFGAASGTVVVALAMMTLSAAAPQFWPAYRHDQLPLPVDRWPLEAYRAIEARVAGIAPTDPAHTPLPTLSEQAPKTPGDFWR